MSRPAVDPDSSEGRADSPETSGREADIELGMSTADQVATFVRATSSLIPGVGPIIGQLITEIIPNQRLDRLENYLRQLNERVERLETIKGAPERIALFEDGALLAIRALSEDRMRHIAEVVSRGLNGSEREVLEARRLLTILDQLNVDHIILLESKVYGRLDDAIERHPDIVEEPVVTMDSEDEELERATHWHLRQQTLLRLGLLQYKFIKPKRGEMPEFDEATGTIKARGTRLTPLALLLLRHLDLADDESVSV